MVENSIGGSFVAGSVASSPQATHINTNGTLDANLLGNPSMNNSSTTRAAPDIVTTNNNNNSFVSATPAAPQRVSIATAEQLAEYDDDL